MGKVGALRDRITDRALHLVLDGKPDSQALQMNLFVKKKKKPDTRLWMRLRLDGESELLELDRHTLTQLVSIPARDLRILGPVFSQSSTILAREKAMVVNLEFIKAIVTAQEVLVLDPTSAAVLPFIEQLKETLLASKAEGSNKTLTYRKEADAQETLMGSEFVGSTQDELPFEFRVLEVALETVCGFLEMKVKELESTATPVLDELTRNVSTSNLELVRSLKSDLTRLLARVQKVRDEMEHLLDDDEDMADLYLTRKLILSQQDDFHSFASPPSSPRVSHFSSRRSSNASYAGTVEDHNVEQLEMLLEAYFVQVDGTQKKLLAVREYIDDTEDYVNIQLDSQRNDLIQLHVTLGILALTASLVSGCAGAFAINIPCPLYSKEGVFVPVVTGFVSASVALFFIILGYARWRGHFTS
ncbi:hypothetical protein GOP47_0003082 [Adiantum capillus-veneris]|uniref:Magnesium transporter n=1 Tax=Adiantum capillus-veneris TaxID=13818 RepID=A0A9D4VBJ4_ADICA|nr:hypothetical protein GOP47_0003082 [Adiantum capillus-veneris]